MSRTLAAFFAMFLIVVHAGLGGWALMGFAELLVPDPPWTRLSNPLFSRAMLALQWSLIALASTVFIGGYAARWRYTPVAMTVIYGAMAGTCAYQTFLILTDPSRFRAMTIEYTEYGLILLFLFGSSHMRERFSKMSHPTRGAALDGPAGLQRGAG